MSIAARAPFRRVLARAIAIRVAVAASIMLAIAVPLPQHVELTRDQHCAGVLRHASGYSDLLVCESRP